MSEPEHNRLFGLAFSDYTQKHGDATNALKSDFAAILARHTRTSCLLLGGYNMLKVIALREDGWAFVLTDAGVLLVRPPYSSSNSTSVSQSAVELGVARHGFSLLEEQFPDWGELIAFLNRCVRKARAARGEKIASAGLGAGIMKFATEVLSGFLHRVEMELLPAGSWDIAERLLVDMLALPGIQCDSALLTRVSSLLSRTLDARKNADMAREELFVSNGNLAGRFPKLADKYGEQSLPEI